MNTNVARWAAVLVVACAATIASAQLLPVVGSKLNGKVAFGRNSLVLPPGEWEVLWTGEGNAGSVGEHARNSTARVLAAQRDDSGRRVKAVVYHVSTLLSTPGTSYWNTNACEPKNPLHLDFSGNFKFPECVIVDYWMAPGATTSGIDRTIWEWSTANDLQLPSAFVVVRYVKYQSGDYLQTHVSVNPDALGLPASIATKRAESEWSASNLKSDSVRREYIERVRKWGKALAEHAGPTVGGGRAKSDTLPDLPEAKK